MGANTAIEWADHTFNPWVGCTKVSPACDHCYAEGWAKRAGTPELWSGERRRTSAANWQKPIKWNREAERLGIRYRVFCASLADVFDNQVPNRWRDDLWHWIELTPYLDWLLLTKRPQNIAKFLPDPRTGTKPWGEGWPNVWLGTTAEDQTELNRRVPHLLSVPSTVRFLSCEPLLGGIDLTDRLWGRDRPCPSCPRDVDCECGFQTRARLGEPALNWIIAGGESGPGARPMHPDWVRSLRDQCAAAGVPFLFKQWGEWLPWEPEHAPCWKAQTGDSEDHHVLFLTDIDNDPRWDDGLGFVAHGSSHAAFQRVGKKRAGRLLDGRSHDGFPRMSEAA